MQHPNFKIGYYIHHHGDGHRQRAIAIAKHYPDVFTLIGTNLTGRNEGIDYIDLPKDDVDNININSHLTSTHYTPYGIRNITHRMRQIVDWIDDKNPKLIISDVSVEIAMLARICSIPTVYMRLIGNRLDPPHLDAFRAAEAVICPFHKNFEADAMPKWLLHKSFYFPNMVAHKNIDHTTNNKNNNIAVIIGAGDHEIIIENLIDIATQLPNYEINVIGNLPVNNKSITIPPNLHLIGWVKNPSSYLKCANIVIGTAGDGVLADIINLNKPYICLPQNRPHLEQITKARSLEKLGIISIYKIKNINWTKVTEQTLATKPLGQILDKKNYSKAAADFIIETAETSTTYD